MLLDTPVRIGVQIEPQHATYGQIRDAVRRLEDAGVDILFNWDHFFPLHGEDLDGLHYESWTMLAAWAEQTERVEFGALVNCNSYRNADLQADMARTIDHISARGGAGRFIFGTGSGWFERDYDEYGYTFGTPGSRLNDLAVGLDRIEARWDRLNPPPTRHIPVLIGGKGEQKTLRIVARHADIWHSFVPADGLAHKVSVIEKWAETDGRDVSGLIISNELKGRDESDADALFDAGVRLYTLGWAPGKPNYDVVDRWLRWRDAKNGA
jgi:probable F420-dependent oxidoreductase